MTLEVFAKLVGLFEMRKRVVHAKYNYLVFDDEDLGWLNGEIDKLIAGEEFDISELTERLKSENSSFHNDPEPGKTHMPAGNTCITAGYASCSIFLTIINKILCQLQPKLLKRSAQYLKKPLKRIFPGQRTEQPKALKR